MRKASDAHAVRESEKLAAVVAARIPPAKRLRKTPLALPPPPTPAGKKDEPHGLKHERIDTEVKAPAVQPPASVEPPASVLTQPDSVAKSPAPADHSNRTSPIKVELTKEARRAEWMKFQRTLETDKGGNRGVEKCPAAVLTQIKSLKDKQSWFNIWLDSDGSWGKVELKEDISRSHVDTGETAVAWLTEGQLADHYKDINIAAAIVAKKRTDDNSWKPHPEVPHLKEAALYKVFLTDKEKKEIVDKHTKSAGITVDVDKCAGGSALSWVRNGATDPNGEHFEEAPPVSMRTSPFPSHTVASPSALGDAALLAISDGKDTETVLAMRKAAEDALKKKEKSERESAAREERRSEQAEKRRQEQVIKKAEQSAFKKSDAGVAKEWLFKLEKDVDNCSRAAKDAASASTDTSMPTAFAKEWKKTFEMHLNQMRTARGPVEAIRDELSSDASALRVGNDLVAKYKTDLKTFYLSRKSYLSKSS